MVVGAGPTGLTAALVLAAHDIRATVLDRRDGASQASRALGLQARSMELLAALGVADRIVAAAYPLGGSTIMRGARALVRQQWVPPDSPYPHTYVLPQQGLEGILRDRLDELGGHVRWRQEVRTLRPGPDGVDVVVGDAVERVAWVVGADGARSRVRESAGIAFEGEGTGEVYHLADLRLHGRPQLDDGVVWLGPQGPLMLMRLPGDLWRIFADVTDDDDLVGREPDAGTLQRLLDDRGSPGLHVGEVSWTSVFRSRLHLAERYRAGRLLLAGDAAHVFPPFGGQGMNLGIQDAVGLGWRLARVIHGRDREDVLDAYARERRTIAASVIREVDGRRRMLALRHPVARGLREVMLRALGASAAAARATSLASSQITHSYRTGRGGARPGVGDRAPDMTLVDGRIHDALRVDRFTLLRFGDLPLPHMPEPMTVLDVDDRTDPGGVARRRYRMGRGVVLVRPDGHIAYRGTDVRVALDRLGASCAYDHVA